MSRQNKAIQKQKLSRQITAMHLRGEKGAASTTATHGKDFTKRLYTSRTRGAKDMKNSGKREAAVTAS